MKISGADTLPFPVAEVWEAILDPRVLVATIPGCERLEATGEHCYAMTVTAGVAAIRGTYAGSCTLSDLAPHRSLVMRLQGAGAPGTVDATVDVHFDEADGGTRVSYDADAVVGGMVGGVGQRMLTSVSHRMAASSSATSGGAGGRSRGRRGPRGGGVGPGSGAAGHRGPARGLHRRPPGRPGRDGRGRLRQGRRARRRRSCWPASSSAGSSGGGDDAASGSTRPRARWSRRSGSGRISARELLDLHLARIAERNPQLNAIVSLDEERARAGAAAADEAPRLRAPRWARCTGCRSRSRTPTRSPAGARRTARRSSPTTSRPPTS